MKIFTTLKPSRHKASLSLATMIERNPVLDGGEPVPTTYDITVGVNETTGMPEIISGNMTEAIAVHNAGGTVNLYVKYAEEVAQLQAVSKMYLSGYLWFGASDEVEDPQYNFIYGFSESGEFTQGSVYFGNADGYWNSKNRRPTGIDQAVEQGSIVFFDMETASGHEYYRAQTVRLTEDDYDIVIGGKYTSSDTYVEVVDGASESHDYLSLYYLADPPHFEYGMKSEMSSSEDPGTED